MKEDITKLLNRRLWDLQRFGITPRKMAARWFNKTEPRIFVISVPKAGTHLVERALVLHPRLYRLIVPTLHPGNLEHFGGLSAVIKKMRPGSVIVSHLRYSERHYELLKRSAIKGIGVIRDPRDVVVSEAFYMARSRKHYYYQYAKCLPLEKRLLRAIIGDPEREYPSIRQTLEWFAGWLNTDFMVVRFEDLVNEKSREPLLRSIFDYIGLDADTRFIARNLISEASPTFRRGRAGTWREYLQGDLYNIFLETVGDLLVRYGYSERCSNESNKTDGPS